MYRELFGLTQQEVARRIGSSVQTVAHWEQWLKIPRPEWFGALAKLYGVDVGATPSTAGTNQMYSILVISSPLLYLAWSLNKDLSHGLCEE